MRIKTLLLAFLIPLLVLMTGCQTGKKNETKNSSAIKFTEENGKLVYLDTVSGVFDKPALITIVNKSESIIEFLPADTKGNTGADYYKINFKKNEFEKYYYVSAMGTGHYYFYDLKKNELVRMEDNHHNNVTEKTKASGRWNSSETGIAEDLAELRQYFKDIHGVTMEAFIEK